MLTAAGVTTPDWQDGQATLNRRIGNILDAAITPDGRLYILAGFPTTSTSLRVLAYFPDGKAETIYTLSNNVAFEARGLEVDSTGRLLIADNGRRQVLAYTTTGGLELVAGAPSATGAIAEGPADKVRLNVITDMAASPTGELYILDGSQSTTRIRRVANGEMTNVNFTGALFSPFLPASNQSLSKPTNLAVLPDGRLVASEIAGNRIIVINPYFPGGSWREEVPYPTSDSEVEDTCASLPAGLPRPPGCTQLTHYYETRPYQYAVPSEDGRELYYFDARGRHLNTVDGRTGERIRGFAYDAAGRLSSITSYQPFVRHNVVRTQTPGGQVVTLGDTVLRINENLEKISYASSPTTTWEFAYTAGGLLEQMWDPRANRGGARSGIPYNFSWEATSLPGNATDGPTVLDRDEDPTGAGQTMAWTVDAAVNEPIYGDWCGYRYVRAWKRRHRGARVTRSTQLGRQTSYNTTKDLVTLNPGTTSARDEFLLSSTVTEPSGQSITRREPDATGTSLAQGSGWSLSSTVEVDPLLDHALQEKTRTLSISSITSDGGSPSASRAALTQTTTRTRSFTLANGLDPTSVTSWLESTSVTASSTTRTRTMLIERPDPNTGYTVTNTSPAGRSTVSVFDKWGKQQELRLPGQVPTMFGYDTARRLTSVTRTDGVHLRQTTTAYPGATSTANRYPSPSRRRSTRTRPSRPRSITRKERAR